MRSCRIIAAASCLGLLVALNATRAEAEESAAKNPPKIGDTIDNFAFHTFEGHDLKLTDVSDKGPVVLVVLRGFPGYQCPVCTQQVADLRKHVKDFKELGATVLLVYPGKADKLTEHAKEFLKDSKLPEPLVLVTDPDYQFAERSHLRWDKAGETAYPSTFVLGKDRKVYYAKVSKSHGDRAKTDMLLDVLRAKRASHAEGREIPQDSGNKVEVRPRR